MAGNPVDEPGEVPACCTYLFDVFAVLGKRWNGLIIGVLLNRSARFSELQRAQSVTPASPGSPQHQ